MKSLVCFKEKAGSRVEIGTPKSVSNRLTLFFHVSKIFLLRPFVDERLWLRVTSRVDELDNTKFMTCLIV